MTKESGAFAMRCIERIRQFVLAAAFGLCVGEVGETTFAGEPSADNDTQATLAARKAFQDDDQLAGLSLGVRVKDGVATVWGLVPTDSVARRVERRVKSVVGVREVRGDLHVQANDDVPARERNRIAKEESDLPAPVVMDSPISLPPPERARRPELNEVFPPDALAAKSPETTRPAADPFTERLVAFKPDPSPQIGKLWRSDKRYAGVEFEVKQGVVRLSGNFESWNDLWPFADAVSLMEGVERVVIAKVSVAGK
jgi:hypothetical protein